MAAQAVSVNTEEAYSCYSYNYAWLVFMPDSPDQSSAKTDLDSPSGKQSASGCASLLYLLIILAGLYYGGMLAIRVIMYLYALITLPLLSVADRKVECVKNKENNLYSSLYGCAELKRSIQYDLKGESACTKFLSGRTGIMAQPAEMHRVKGERIYRIWFFKNENASSLAMAECRRDTSTDQAESEPYDANGLLQWREVAFKGEKISPVSAWSSGEERIFYDNPDPDCVGMTLDQCKIHQSQPVRNESIGARMRPPVLSTESDLEKRAQDEINKFENWSGDGPAPQPIRAMEDLWRCRKYGSC